ncbi:hypothetical protein SODALDRAFT_274067, partial [Sodiomyces alkalinus F11]
DIANTTSRTGVNKKILRAIEYISQFNVQVVYKPGKDYIILDTLRRLPTIL